MNKKTVLQVTKSWVGPWNWTSNEGYTLCDYIPFNAKLSSSKSRLNQSNALFCLCFTFYLLTHTYTHTHTQIFKYQGDGQRLRLQNPARKAAVPDPAAVYNYTHMPHCCFGHCQSRSIGKERGCYKHQTR